MKAQRGAQRPEHDHPLGVGRQAVGGRGGADAQVRRFVMNSYAIGLLPLPLPLPLPLGDVMHEGAVW